VEAMQKKIDDLKTAGQVAKDKQKAAKDERKRLERDIWKSQRTIRRERSTS
jgi:hypothetical protein